MATVIDFYRVSRSRLLPQDNPDLELIERLVDESRRLKVRICELDRLIKKEMDKPED
ncbi:hypothetical protein [Mesorhizobium sp. WSM2561]|uniref:hypothetical protein n=1 Tax=Mesorhizobium sp. WSM2561 TaxID=1040985 RepID=UPI0004ADBCA4|nr:hypothetical protein [Mesorhizobium sp. WSM2561]